MKAHSLLLTLGLSVAAFAQDTSQPAVIPAPPPSAPAQRSAADLEQLAAPMALYPDPLIAVILPAAVYPVEIVKAARFVANTNNLATIDDQPWDDNVKAVARFPSVIQYMSDELDWTVELGEAFTEQPLELMDAIQALRAKAQSAGTLQTTPEQVVIITNAVVERTYETQIVYVTNTIVQIMPANPQVIYVPVYNPVIVYTPPPAYVYNPMAPLIAFGAGIAVGAIIANNHCNWYYGGVYYGRGGFVVWGGSAYGRYPYYPPPLHYRPPPYRPPPGYRPPRPGYRPPGFPPPGALPPGRPTPYPTQWRPDQGRIRKSGSARATVATTDARGWASTTPRPSIQPALPNRPAPSTGGVGARPTPDIGGGRPSTGAIGSRPDSGNSPIGNRPASNPSINQPMTRPSPLPGTPGAGTSRPAPGNPRRPAPESLPSSGSGLSEMNNAGGSRDFSKRGSASRGKPAGAGRNRSGSNQ